MPLKKLEKPTIVYLAYHRCEPNDFLSFRKELVACATTNIHKRDIAVDLSGESIIGDSEILLLSNIAHFFLGTNRHLHLIAGEPVRRKLEANSLHTSGNVMLYDNHDAFIKSLNTPVNQEKKPETPRG
jgi:hypothetical protein